MKKFLFVILAVAAALARGQELTDVIGPLYTFDMDDDHYNGAYGYTYPLRVSALNTASPLSAAIGNATVASGQMIPEFGVNPANLAMTKYSSVQVNGVFSRYNGVSRNSLGGISYIVPVQVYRGSLTFGAGVNRERDYNLYYQDSDIIQRSHGGLYNWHFNGAVEVQKDIFFGGEFSLLSGTRDNDIDFKDALASVDGYVEENAYFGAGARLGVTYHVLPVLNLGFSLDLPTLIGVDYSLRIYDSNSRSTSEFSIKAPGVLRAGLALTLKIVDLYYSYDYANWQNMIVRSSDLEQSAVDQLNREITNNLSITQSHHIGMALHVPLLPLHFYFGYQYLPDIYQGLNSFSLAKLVPHELSDRFRSSFSWGASLFIKQGFSVSASFETWHAFYNSVEETPLTSNLSLSYFF